MHEFGSIVHKVKMEDEKTEYEKKEKSNKIDNCGTINSSCTL